MKDREESGEIEAELWIRSFAPVGGDERQEAAVRRLQELHDEGRLADLTVRMWGKKLRRSPAAYTEEGQVVVERFGRFREWAAEQDRSLAPFFEERAESCEFTGESDDVIVLPSVALAEFRDGDLVHLAPHVDGDDRVSVEDRIDELREAAPADPPATVIAAE